MLRPAHLFAGLGLLASLGACATPTETAPLLVESGAYRGSVLSGPLLEGEDEELDFDDAWLAEVQLGWYASLPRADRPMDGRLVVREGDDSLFVTRAELADGIGEGLPSPWKPSDRPLWSDTVQLALPAGCTLTIGASDNLTREARLQTPWERFGVEVSRGRERADEVVAALVLEGWIVAQREDDESLAENAAALAGEPVRVREQVLLEAPPVLEGRPLSIVLPTPSAEYPQGGLVLQLHLLRRSPAALAEPIAAARESVVASGVAARQRSARFEETVSVERERLLEAIEAGRLSRPAVVYIATTLGAYLTEELALVAEAEALQEFVRYAASRADRSSPATVSELGWRLERRTLEWLLARREDEQRALEPELAGVLSRAGGELASYPDLLRELLDSCASVQELRDRIRQENLVFLEDARPGPRVHAYDWLVAKGFAPEGFDPLAPRAERRAALAAYEDSLMTAEDAEEEQP